MFAYRMIDRITIGEIVGLLDLEAINARASQACKLAA